MEQFLLTALPVAPSDSEVIAWVICSDVRCVHRQSANQDGAGASVPDPKSDHSHMADALGYACIALQKGSLPWSLGVTGFCVS